MRAENMITIGHVFDVERIAGKTVCRSRNINGVTYRTTVLPPVGVDDMVMCACVLIEWFNECDEKWIMAHMIDLI